MKSNVDVRLRDDGGFSLVELLISLAVLLTVSAAAFLLLNQNQKVYLSTSNNATMYTTVRSAAELISQEIGQAGSLCGLATSATGCGTTTVHTAVSSGTILSLDPQTALFLFPGEKLTLDPNSQSKEVVQIAVSANAVNLATGTITLQSTTPVTKTHSVGAYVTARGAFPQGVLSPGYPNVVATPTPLQGSQPTKLMMYGDINGDGTLVYVEYNCSFLNVNSGTGLLTRSITVLDSTITPIVKKAPDVLIDNLIWIAPTGYDITKPGNAIYCFSYPALITQKASDGITYNATTQVQLLISVQSANLDPQTHQRGQLTKSFLQLSPRNVVAAVDLLNNNVTEALQPTPLNVPLN